MKGLAALANQERGCPRIYHSFPSFSLFMILVRDGSSTIAAVNTAPKESKQWIWWTWF